MRFSSLLLCLALLILGCSDQNFENVQNQKVLQSIESLLDSKLHDPDSYEFVELTLIDSVLYEDNIEFRKQMFRKRLEDSQFEIETFLMRQKEMPEYYTESDLTKLNTKLAGNEKVLHQIDSLENVLGERVKEVASYTYRFKFRSKNALGAKVLGDYYIQTGIQPDFEIINFTEDEKELKANPNDFPGYRDMIKNNL